MDNSELRGKIKANLEHMIVHRIMQLVSHEVIAPSIHSGMQQLNHDIITKLQEVGEAAISGVKKEQAQNYHAVRFGKKEEEQAARSNNNSNKASDNAKSPAALSKATSNSQPSLSKYTPAKIAAAKEVYAKQEEQVRGMEQWHKMISKLPQEDYNVGKYAALGSDNKLNVKEAKPVPLNKETMTYLNNLYNKTQQQALPQTPWITADSKIKQTEWLPEVKQTKLPATAYQKMYGTTEAAKEPRGNNLGNKASSSKSVLGMPASAVKLMSSGYNYGMIGADVGSNLKPSEAKMLIAGLGTIMGGSLLTPIAGAGAVTTTTTAAESTTLFGTGARGVFNAKPILNFFSTNASTATGGGLLGFGGSGAVSIAATSPTPWLIPVGATILTANHYANNPLPSFGNLRFNWFSDGHASNSTASHNEPKPLLPIFDIHNSGVPLIGGKGDFGVIGAGSLFDTASQAERLNTNITLPVPTPPMNIFSTPNDRDKINELNRNRGFAPVNPELANAGLRLITPAHETKLDDHRNVTPIPQEKHWSDHVFTQDYKIDQWDVKPANVKEAPEVYESGQFGKIYKDPTQKVGNKDIWWSKDTAKHSGQSQGLPPSTYKLFIETKTQFKWIGDADPKGKIIENKHKSPVRELIEKKNLRKIK